MIDIRSALWEIKYRIILITVCCTGLACFYAECKAPIYETNLLYTIVQGDPGEVVELVNNEIGESSATAFFGRFRRAINIKVRSHSLDDAIVKAETIKSKMNKVIENRNRKMEAAYDSNISIDKTYENLNDSSAITAVIRAKAHLLKAPLFIVAILDNDNAEPIMVPKPRRRYATAGMTLGIIVAFLYSAFCMKQNSRRAKS